MRAGRWIAGLALGIGLLAHLGMRADAQTQPSETQLEAVSPEQQSPEQQPPETAPVPRKAGIDKLTEDLAITQKQVTELKRALAEAKAAGETAAKRLGQELAKAEKQAAQLARELEVVKGAPRGASKEDVKSAADQARAAGTDAAKSAGDAATTTGKERGDSAWMLTASAFVMFMIPGLALFYGGMVRRRNVLATMMQSMVALAIVGVYWIAIGYSLAFGPSVMKLPMSLLGGTAGESGGLVGWSWDLVFLKGVKADDKLPAYDISVYLHVMFQGMFAILTPALISGAIAERIRFWPYCLFMLMWVTFVYCPLAHMVWAFDWFDPSVVAAKRGAAAIGLLGKLGALDFAGGTVVHIAAGMAGLACCLVLRKRHGYPEQVAHPNSMVLTLLGAGLLWFGWFGFNGGSGLNSTPLAASAFAATQAAAASAGIGWVVVEWLHKGKPTALGLASGIVAGLVAVTPASGFVYAWGGLFIGLAAAVVCYCAVNLKALLGYDDSLDAFGVHGVGGFVGAVLTGVFASLMVNPAGGDGPISYRYHRSRAEALPGLIDKATAEKRAANIELLKATHQVDDEVAALKIAEKEEALSKAGGADLKTQIDDLKIEDLEDEAASYPAGSAGKTAADKKLAEAHAKKAELGAKLKATASLRTAVTEARDAETEAKKKLDTPTAVLKDKADALANLEKERQTIQGFIDKQEDKDHGGKDKRTVMSQVVIQFKAAIFSVVFSLILSFVLAFATQLITRGKFAATEKEEAEGLDRAEHGEVGFDFSGATESVSVVTATPRPAVAPPGNGRYDLQLVGADADEVDKAWASLCQPSEGPPDADFQAIYPHLTTVQGTRFRFRGGDPEGLSRRLESLFSKHLGGKVRVAKVG